MAEGSKTIGFKLSGDTLERLETLASRQGMTVHEFAKEALIAKLNQKDDEESLLHKMSMKLTNLESTVSELRKDVAVSTEALLINGGVSASEAERWVDEKLRSS